MQEPEAAPSAQQTASSDKTAGTKRKKSGAVGNADDSDKRVKTPRACDSCRTKKIRCLPLESEAAAPKCKYCSSHNIDCTWYLPIGQTRWKNKGGKPPAQSDKQARSSPAHSVDNVPETNSPKPLQPPTLPTSTYYPTSLPPLQRTLPVDTPAVSRPPLISSSSAPSVSSLPSLANEVLPSSHSLPQPPTRTESRLLGPTSITHLLHDTATFPPERLNNYMSSTSMSWEVKESHGFVKVFQNRRPQSDITTLDHAVNPSTLEQLVNVYLNTHAPLFPILSRADFLTSTPLEPMLLWTTCGVAALSSKVPSYVLRAIKNNVAVASRESDMLTSTNLQNVQAHLIFAVSMEMERGGVGTRVWNSVGLAIRMAQNLGLHRENDSKRDIATDMHHVELRRRVWGGCIIADRWVSAIFGLPQMIDLTDCDRLYPAEYEYLPGQRADEVDTSVKPFLGMPAEIELSILLGDVLKLLYSPSGLAGVEDNQLDHIRSALFNWRYQLAPELQLGHPQASNPMAGFLTMVYVPVLFLFYRPFMNPSNKLGEYGIKFCVTQAEFLQLRDLATEVIYWLEGNTYILESWAVAMYSLFICALIQYHHFVKHREESAITLLRQAAQLFTKCANEECWGRNKVAEIVGILEHTAVSLRSATAHPSAAHTPVDKPATTSQSYQYKPANSSGSEYAWPAAPCSTQQSFQPGSAPVNIANSSMPQQPAHMAPQFQPSRFMVDPQQPFTFLPGSDFAAPGPSQGPLSFDPYLPSLAADQTQWQALMEGLEEAASQPPRAVASR